MIKKALLLIFGMLGLFACYAQHSISFIVKNKDQQPLPAATASIQSLNRSAIADTSGLITFNNIPAGTYSITISFTGFTETSLAIKVPTPDNLPIEVALEESEESEEEVVVTATRISRTITNIPTRVEVISGEELGEKGNMRPGEIRMLLSESTGIQVQQTSATSFNAGIRIQGLDGRYTQILRDGYPLYGGFSGSLSIMQTTPLDLRQVEIIKGSASTLYGGGAIAGLVNLVSKTPNEQRELSFIANGTTAGGLDVSGLYSERNKRIGITVFTARNSNKPYDPANIDLTAIPKFERYTINPRLFFYGKKITADIGVSYITEDRTGGSMRYIKVGGNGFFEKNNTDRFTTQFGLANRLSDHATLQFKNSYSHFNRIITIPSYSFDALQKSSFSELTWNNKREKADWVIGVNVLTDDLDERHPTNDLERDYHYNTYGLFVQNAWSVNKVFTLESGLRGDYISQYAFELMPRLSAMFRINSEITTRIGGGFGYKTPTIFTEEAERIQFRNLFPINLDQAKTERSIGGNWDINYRTAVGEVGVNLNHLFFYTRLNRPIVLVGAPGGKVELVNSAGHLDTKGMETNLRLVYNDFKLFVGYTYTDANTHFGNTREWLPLTARHRLNNVLMYEVEEKWKIGLETYYYSKQQLTDRTFGKSYWLMGFMVEKIWEHISLYINFENFTDTRQTRFDTIHTGTVENPVFKDIYAPVEGFIINGGVKVRL